MQLTTIYNGVNDVQREVNQKKTKKQKTRNSRIFKRNLNQNEMEFF